MSLRPNPFKLSVVVPCYNEGSHLKQFITALKFAVAPITKDYEIILVNDGSKDNTKVSAHALIGDGNIRYGRGWLSLPSIHLTHTHTHT